MSPRARQKREVPAALNGKNSPKGVGVPILLINGGSREKGEGK